MKAAPGVADRQLADLEGLGLDWDGSVIRQSRRLDIYLSYAAKLASYECFCSRREIAEASQAPHGSYRPYPGTCARLTPAQRAARRRDRAPALRVRGGNAAATVVDRFAGMVSGRVDDFVLLRADGTPAYNLAVVVDDALQGVSQVTRGADLLASAPRQAWLTNRLGFEVADYAHLGLVLNQRGERLAKRDHPADMQTLLDAGLRVRDIFWLLTDSCGFPRTEGPAELLQLVRDEPGLLRDRRLADPVIMDAHGRLPRPEITDTP